MPHIPIEPGSESTAVIRALAEAKEHSEAKARRQLAADKLKVWQNDFQDLVEAELKGLVGKENFESLRPWIACTNVLEKVVRKVALNYDRPARRAVVSLTPSSPVRAEQDPEDAAAGVEPEPPEPVEERPPGQDGLEFILSFEDRDALMAEVERLVMFHEAVWVVPVVRPHPVTGLPHLEHDIITPAIGDVIVDPDDPSRELGLYWTKKEYIGTKEVEVIRYLDAVQWLKFDETGRVLANELHGIGRKAWTRFNRGRPLDPPYYKGAGNDLYRATLEISLKRTFLARAFFISSWKQVFVTGQLDEKTKAQELLHPYYPIEGGASSTLQTFGLGPENGLTEHDANVRADEEEIASKYGLPPHVYRGMSEGGPLSGSAMKMAMSEALRQASERRKYLVEGELDLLDADRAVCEAYSLFPPGMTLPAGTPIIVDPQEPDFSPSPQEQRDDDDWHLERGTRSIVDVMRRENPDLTDDEALKRLEENRRTNRRFGAGQRAETPAASPFARLGLQ